MRARGWTPLHLVTEEGHADVAKVLVDMGADKAPWGGRFSHGARLELTLPSQGVGRPGSRSLNK